MFSRLVMPKPVKDGRPRTTSQAVLAWICGPGRRMATTATLRVAHQIRRNLTLRRLLSFPHFLFLFWVVILLWGERWVFDSKVAKCDWESWEKWPKEANPHHLIFVADPQLIDPHSYPGRPWPLSPLTVLVTDNYMRRGYTALQRQLKPDSVFFLGDLFDGGREWKTRQGAKFVDPKWGGERSATEKKWVKTWHRKYDDDYWIREYQRFSNIFFAPFNEAGGVPGPYQRGRKLVASLPGNHDLGFGAQIQVPVRDRFSAFFGETNRVDVVGNHTIVSVDTVSLSADTSRYKDEHDLKPIYGPVHEFLDQVQATKRKAAQQELAVWHGVDRGLKLRHKVEDVNEADLSRSPMDPGEGAPDFPTILLTHVPLYREPGTPCGPHREHWPPSKSTLRKDGTVDPTARDDRNAISVSAGYQYQNVLNDEDSVKLIKKIGNVVHAFSGDDHDYCELVHSSAQENVPEITVKSISMAMGVPTPGFVMVSLFNPIDAHGKPIPNSPEKTIQTHLCLLPNQYHTYMKYITFIIVSVVLLLIRAYLVPALHLTPFALEPETHAAPMLPIYKDKVKMEPPEYGALRSPAAATSGARSQANGGNARWASKKSKNGQRWGWSNGNGGPRITLDDHFYDGGKANRGRRELRLLGRELWTTTWRLAWLTVLYWAYLARKG
ncbi:hypothetical protein H634G_04307 [Metarhizium anisopliae BRIP 53293]|uniref:Uncharacterized protein n=1 Tax=Metarhizium anisopliae BRIP 53293 TaxID=1291518 RepID=A0A0D9P1U8_METAN|nr:hypothetical protein H634G_04307 [Metarhizium anisopliae BRIP 53293]KJK92818.1 hypothetical protein H633G_03194 [Metarhizium anisopliae BRIP 53284]